MLEITNRALMLGATIGVLITNFAILVYFFADALGDGNAHMVQEGAIRAGGLLILICLAINLVL